VLESITGKGYDYAFDKDCGYEGELIAEEKAAEEAAKEAKKAEKKAKEGRER